MTFFVLRNDIKIILLSNCIFQRSQGIKLDCGYRLDLLVQDKVIVEIKSVEKLIPVHKAQLLSYLKLSGCKVGLLINFNVQILKDGIQRVVNDFPNSQHPQRPLR